jgi:GTP-binding protein LepA
VLEAIVTRLPPPKGDREAPLKALLVDSWYDAYLGVVVLVRVIDGVKGPEDPHDGHRRALSGRPRRRLHAQESVNVRARPRRDRLHHRRIKEVADTRVGDTITDDRKPTAEPLPGFKPAQPVVFCGLFPVDAADFEDLRESLGKLRLNDASFSYEMETSAALGFGFRCGFLGPAASRDHPGAAGARVQPRPHRHRAVVVYKMHMTDGTSSSCTTRPTCPTS